MLDSILLAPDNRFLSLSTQDFGLYGGQTPLHLQVGRAAETMPTAGATPASNGSAAAPPDATPSAGSQSALENPGTDAVETPALGTSFGGLSQTIQPTVPGSAPTEAFGAPPLAPSLAPFVPAVVSTSLSGSSSDPAVIASPQTDAISPATSLHDTVESLAPTVTLTAPQLLGDAVEGVTTLVGATAQTVTGTLSDASEAVGSLVDDAATGIAAPLAATVGPLADTVVSFVEDDLAGLAGADPLGGVATLVSLVSADDLFDVSENTPDGLINTTAPDLLSSLTSDLLPDNPLLGDHGDDDAGALAGVIHDDPLGIL